MSEEQRAERLLRAQAFFDDMPEPEGFLSDAFDDARYDRAAEVDPSLQRASDLFVRLAGPDVSDGFYDPSVEAALAGPLSGELHAATGRKGRPGAPRFGLVGVSSGSVVLHYRPVVAMISDDGDQRGVEVSPVDQAVRRVLTLHSMLESEADATAIAQHVAGNNALLAHTRGVIEALSRFGLDMSTTWYSPSGVRVRSTVTLRGRNHAQMVFAREDEPKPQSISGRVTALDEEGWVWVRSPSQKFQVKVDDDEVREFDLGEQVHLLVLVTTPTDRVGLRGKPSYKFQRRLLGSEDNPLPES